MKNPDKYFAANVTQGRKKKTYQGVFKPANPQKYRGAVDNITFRSSWELKMMNALDQNPNVVEWASEEIAIPYLSPLDNRIHRYYVDFYVCTLNKDGTKTKSLIEVKPAKETKPPVTPKRTSATFIREAKTWAINEAKWKAARRFCEDLGWEWRIATEYELGLAKQK